MVVFHILALKSGFYKLSYVQPFLFFFLSPYHFYSFVSFLVYLPGSSGIVRYTNIPPGVYKLRVVAWDPVRKERAVIRNKILVHKDDTFCAVLKTNNGVIIGGNNNVTVGFSGAGQTTGFQCILDKQWPYFECMLCHAPYLSFTLSPARMFCMPFKFPGNVNCGAIPTLFVGAHSQAHAQLSFAIKIQAAEG